MLVISDSWLGQSVSLSHNVIGEAVASQKLQLQQPVKNTLEWVEQESSGEKKIIEYIEKKLDYYKG